MKMIKTKEYNEFVVLKNEIEKAWKAPGSYRQLWHQNETCHRVYFDALSDARRECNGIYKDDFKEVRKGWYVELVLPRIESAIQSLNAAMEVQDELMSLPGE
jgi:hypothetical protein